MAHTRTESSRPHAPALAFHSSSPADTHNLSLFPRPFCKALSVRSPVLRTARAQPRLLPYPGSQRRSHTRATPRAAKATGLPSPVSEPHTRHPAARSSHGNPPAPASQRRFSCRRSRFLSRATRSSSSLSHSLALRTHLHAAPALRCPSSAVYRLPPAVHFRVPLLAWQLLPPNSLQPPV